jgi:site-specific DNA-methyltransferase (adenine-specific)
MSSRAPFFELGGIELWHGDCLDHVDLLDRAEVLVSDPPYGIAYNSGSRRATLAASIEGDHDTSLRDWVLGLWGQKPALVFGSWKKPRPDHTHTRLVWDTKGALGMGDLSVPWKPSDQEIYVIGKGFAGPRTTNVLTCAPVQATARNGRVHPHQKPVPLMRMLLEKCPPGVVIDPFAGSGSTLVACAQLGIPAIGIEVDRDYCQIAARRISAELAAPDLFRGAA